MLWTNQVLPLLVQRDSLNTIVVAVKIGQFPYFSCQNPSTPPTHSVVISLSPVRARFLKQIWWKFVLDPDDQTEK